MHAANLEPNSMITRSSRGIARKLPAPRDLDLRPRSNKSGEAVASSLVPASQATSHQFMRGGCAISSILVFIGLLRLGSQRQRTAWNAYCCSKRCSYRHPMHYTQIPAPEDRPLTVTAP
jgi:hypothetical protein